MLDTINQSVIITDLNFQSILICTICSIFMGMIISKIYTIKNTYSKGFVVTLALLPAMVQVVIMLVNGNIGTGVAVAGAFGLVRFRSAPGSARDIGNIFFAMAIGIATGMGYIFYAFIFLTIIGVSYIILILSKFGTPDQDFRILKITIPENMDYDNLFNDIMEKYGSKYELEKVKTTNMGSLFELTYKIKLKIENNSKLFLDELRCRNGNLNISLSRAKVSEEL